MAANTVIDSSAGTVIVTSGAIAQTVVSVNGKTGALSLAASDVSAPSIAQLAAVGGGNGASLVGFEQALSGAVQRTLQAKGSDIVSVMDFGAHGNGVLIQATSGVSITSGAATLTVVGASFTAGDVGKQIIVTGAGTSGAALACTISGFTSATVVTLSANASTTLTNAASNVSYATDDYSFFQAAINALPAIGGTIRVPNAIYGMGTKPNIGTKSVTWEIASGCVFTGVVGVGGAGGWPRAATNATLAPYGVFAQGQNSYALTSDAPATMVIEALQPSTYNGNSVALYCGAMTSSPTGNIWAINPLIQANAGAGGVVQCLEVDTNNFSASAIVKGISISGIGTVNPYAGLEITRGGGTGGFWTNGITLDHCVTGIRFNGGITTGINMGIPSGSLGTGQLIVAKQLANGADSVVLQRNTDSSSSGWFLRCVDAANSTNLFLVDVLGNLQANSAIITATATASAFVATGSAPSTAVGQFGFGGVTTNTVGGAGGAAALPASPAGYVIASVNGSTVKVPYYSP